MTWLSYRGSNDRFSSPLKNPWGATGVGPIGEFAEGACVIGTCTVAVDASTLNQ